LKTSENDNRKILNRERETPPTPPHKNPVNNMPITDKSFEDYRKKKPMFWNGKDHVQPKKKHFKNTLTGRTPFCFFYMCINTKIPSAFQDSISTSAF
jgi:hypothetical protein